jgi:endonuclease-8
MPEVMEIRKYSDLINMFVKGKQLINIKIINGRYKKHSAFESYNNIKKALPLKLIESNSKGKFIYLTFEKNFYILNTLGLSGGWAFLPSGKIQYKMPKLLEYIDKDKVESYLLQSINHINIEFEFDVGTLVFFDMLSFGTVKVETSIEQLNKKLETIGPDIMNVDTTFDIFLNRIRTRVNMNKPIGVVLMNQKIISGVGNYIRADVLWLSKISPFTNINKLTDIQLKSIFHSIKVITWGNYNRELGINKKQIKKSDKIPHDYKRDFFVYREQFDIYGNPVVKQELYEGSQKRFIYWVPSIQK